MKVVANRSFFGNGIQAKKGSVIEVSDKLGKAWLDAGIVGKADDKAEVTVATTSPRKTPKPSKEDKTDTTGEVVDGKTATSDETVTVPETGGNPNADGATEKSDDSDKTTLDEVKDEKADTTVVKSADDATTTEKVEQNPTPSVKPQVGNTNANTKKGSK